jgi:hypothetical protein
MQQEVKTGLENAPKHMQDFVNFLEANKQKKQIIKKPCFILKYNKFIIKIIEKPYKLLKYFIFFSVLIALTVEQGVYYYVQ